MSFPRFDVYHINMLSHLQAYVTMNVSEVSGLLAPVLLEVGFVDGLEYRLAVQLSYSEVNAFNRAIVLCRASTIV